MPLEGYCDVVNGDKAAAKAGAVQARAWLAQYLMGRPEGKAPTPLTVVVQQLNRADPLVEKHARPVSERQEHLGLHANDGWEAQIRALVAAELACGVDNRRIHREPRKGGASRRIEPLTSC